jgi:DNA-binding NtrC family response regulator
MPDKPTNKPIRLLIVDDEEPFRTGLCQRLRRQGFDALGASCGEEAIAEAGQNLFDIAIVDIRMPGMDGIKLLSLLKEMHPSIEVLILTGVASVDSAIEAMKLGAYDYLSKPCRFEELTLLIEKAYEKKFLRDQNLLLERELRRLAHAEFIGKSEKAMEIRQFIKSAARADCSILIEGESGSGKELIAREIHRRSPSANSPFVVLDCGSFPETLLADELMGHEKGAYTTAVESRRGLLEMADGGTLLIDEIGEMSPANQAALLRVVETKRFRRIGGSKELSVDVRIIASTNRTLSEEVANGTFRKDLYYRLDVMSYTVPPLRQRKEDIALLADYFLDLLNRGKGAKKSLRPEDKDLLVRHDWPGNIRELANLIERGFFLASGNEITLAAHIQPQSMESENGQASPTANGEKLSDIERHHIHNMLAGHGWNKKAAAQALGISRSRLYNLINKFDIPTSPD